MILIDYEILENVVITHLLVKIAVNINIKDEEGIYELVKITEEQKAVLRLNIKEVLTKN